MESVCLLKANFIILLFSYTLFNTYTYSLSCYMWFMHFILSIHFCLYYWWDFFYNLVSIFNLGFYLWKVTTRITTAWKNVWKFWSNKWLSFARARSFHGDNEEASGGIDGTPTPSTLWGRRWWFVCGQSRRGVSSKFSFQRWYQSEDRDSFVWWFGCERMARQNWLLYLDFRYSYGWEVRICGVGASRRSIDVVQIVGVQILFPHMALL